MDYSPEQQVHLIKHMSLNSPLGDNIPTAITPIGSPHMDPWSSPISSCSGCSSCVSSEVESPLLFQVKAASQTIESSGEDFDVDLPLTEEAVCNMPYISSPARESSDVTEVKKQQQGEETQTEEKKDMESIFETNSPKPEGSSLPIPIPSTNLNTGTHKFLSPVKDPSSLGSLGDEYVMDLSAVTTNPDQEESPYLMPRESRFVYSSELKFMDTLYSQGSIMEMDSRGEDIGLSQPSGTPLSGSDKENIAPSSAPCSVSHSGPDPSAIADKAQAGNKQTDLNENYLEYGLSRAANSKRGLFYLAEPFSDCLSILVTQETIISDRNYLWSEARWTSGRLGGSANDPRPNAYLSADIPSPLPRHQVGRGEGGALAIAASRPL
ncbi:hypothetical protein C7M84_022894 [Penaeus vannamei]|uniref:Uncharacterized protein n=1 Tax=Penaeus vannamei TaxID=6689 RepID=A0A423U5D4_PENVA|nr:hypothetical protein C7M84_022894 [Penaeus vannamei]